MKEILAKATHKIALVCILVIGFCLVFILIIGGCAIMPPKLPPTSHVNSVDGLEAYLNRVVETGNPPGLSLVVVKETQIIYSQGFGMADGPRNQVVTKETIYQWWSLTKIFTAVAILQFQEQGMFKLDDSVKKYLPFLEVKYPGFFNTVKYGGEDNLTLFSRQTPPVSGKNAEKHLCSSEIRYG